MTQELLGTLTAAFEVALKDGKRDIATKLRSIINLNSRSNEARQNLKDIAAQYETSFSNAPQQQVRRRPELTSEDFSEKKTGHRTIKKGVVVRAKVVEKKVAPTTEVVQKAKWVDNEAVVEAQKVELFNSYLKLSDTQIIDKFQSLKGLRNFANERLGLGLSKNSSETKTIEAVRNHLLDYVSDSTSNEEE